MKTQNITAENFAKSIVTAMHEKIAAHIAENGHAPADVEKSIKKISIETAQFLIDAEKKDFPDWVKGAPVKSIMRAVNFVHALAHREGKQENAVSLGNDLIAQSLILTARILKTDNLPLELVKYQVMKGKECEELSTMTKGKNIMKAARKMSPKTALSMISNRCGKNGYMKFFGIVSRADDKSVIINKESKFFTVADSLVK